MPIECTQLKDRHVPLDRCPHCHEEPFEPFMRGTVQRSQFTLWSWPPLKWRPHCALICSRCKEIVGYEAPIVLGDNVVGSRHELLLPHGWQEFDAAMDIVEDDRKVTAKAHREAAELMEKLKS